MTFGIVQLMPILSPYDNSKDFQYVLIIVIHDLIATYYLFKWFNELYVLK